MKAFLAEFKTFIARGNVMDMAVGVIVGGAFKTIADSLTNDILMPLLGILVNRVSFADLSVNVGGAVLTEDYANLLSTAFFGDPVAFARKLTTDSLEDTMCQAIRLTAYDAELYPVELEAALDTLDGALADGTFTEAQQGWAELLRLYLTTPIDQRNDLPRSPVELE